MQLSLSGCAKQVGRMGEDSSEQAQQLEIFAKRNNVTSVTAAKGHGWCRTTHITLKLPIKNTKKQKTEFTVIYAKKRIDTPSSP
jgi:hypothetical protein